MMESETSWQGVSEWYGRAVGSEGHYYHQHIILPKSLKLLDLREGSSLLDLACGQGVLGRRVPEGVHYQGVDVAPALINQAKRLDRRRGHLYLVADVTRPLPIEKRDFTHAAVILSLQNVRNPRGVLDNAGTHLGKGGRLLVVLNHPCFRIPRQSGWGVDEEKKAQYRRVERYMTAMEIPIAIHPGMGEKSESTRSYHHSISDYSRMLHESSFVIEIIEEWTSDKVSAGKAARMENRARKEFPLFMAILARKDR